MRSKSPLLSEFDQALLEHLTIWAQALLERLTIRAKRGPILVDR